MDSKLTLGSLFDGSGGFPLGAFLSGITPLWSSEIEPFPIRVTTKRLPTVTHYGDINKIDGASVPPVDIITGGFCCQDLSVAGKRAGLHGERSGLFFEVIRIIKEMRAATENAYPRFAVLENVPGMYSSAGGADFLEVLNELIKIKDKGEGRLPPLSVPMPEKGRWSTAGLIVGDDFSLGWRTFDAQFWGVAQRRRRCYIVVDFAGGCAEDILFNESRLCGNPPQSGFAWQGAAGDTAARAGGTGCIGFEPGASSRLGGHVWNEHVGALRAHAGDNQTAVMYSAAFMAGQGAKAGSIAYSESVAPTLKGTPSGLNQSPSTVISIENHPADSRVKLNGDGVVQTLSERMGTGGGNVPLVMEDTVPKTLKIRAGCKGGGKGALIQDNKSATLSCNNDQTVFVPYGISSYDSNAMKSPNPHSGIYEAETARTLDSGGGRPDCNQGGIAVCVQGSMIGRDDKNGPQGDGVNEGVSFTLNTVDRHSVAYAMTTGCYTQVSEEKAPTLQARDYKDAPIVIRSKYIVRRLTPQECALLQGFPPDWCSGLETPEPTEEDISFWSDVWETHRRVIGKSSRPKSRNQIIKWLQNPHSDSAEYKMWGNGVALPNVVFVLSGIVWVSGL